MGKNNSNLFYTCSLIEYIGRETANRRSEVLDQLGLDAAARIYEYADVFHCEPIEKVADDFIEEYEIKKGRFDNVGDCRYRVPDYWDIGAVFERLIEDAYEEGQVIKGLFDVYHSWIEEKISDYNTDFYYQSRGYIAACYAEGEVLE